MVIETKFSLDDTVWFMRDNYATWGKVKKIEIKVGDQIQISYSGKWAYSTWDFENWEHSVFPTKEALLASL